MCQPNVYDMCKYSVNGALSTVNVPTNVYDMCKYSVNGALSTVNVPTNVYDMCKYSVNGALSTVNVPTNVYDICKYSVNGALSTVNVPTNVYDICKYSVNGALSTVNVSANVYDMCKYRFNLAVLRSAWCAIKKLLRPVERKRNEFDQSMEDPDELKSKDGCACAILGSHMLILLVCASQRTARTKSICQSQLAPGIVCLSHFR